MVHAADHKVLFSQHPMGLFRVLLQILDHNPFCFDLQLAREPLRDVIDRLPAAFHDEDSTSLGGSQRSEPALEILGGFLRRVAQTLRLLQSAFKDRGESLESPVRRTLSHIRSRPPHHFEMPFLRKLTIRL